MAAMNEREVTFITNPLLPNHPNYKFINGLIHSGGQSPHDVIVSQRHHL
jgi:hypothetical protein